MADIIATGTSGYATGEIDTATVLVNDVSPRDARHPNGCAAAVIQVEGVLGSAVTLKGALQDLASRLAVAISGTGQLILNASAGLSGILGVINGGTGRSTLTAERVLIGNGGGIPLSVTGLLYHGPTSTGAGSLHLHEGTVTIATNQALQGIHYYTSFTLNAGIAVTLNNTSGHLCIVATDTITINGTIDAVGAGANGGTGVSSTGNQANIDGGYGLSQPGGGGSGGASTDTAIRVGGRGGGVPGIRQGGAGSVNASSAGSGATQITTPYFGGYGMLGGGAGGGGGGAGNSGPGPGASGGAGGGSITLIAPTIILGAAAVLNTSGANGGTGGATNWGAGGGGGAGNIYIACRSFTDNGCTFTQNGGSGGAAAASGQPGGAGAAGVKQIVIYN